ncbi:MAG: prepilin-type N-terminal cleavage/methylation domain-containing protein [Bacillota bacterium]|nr:prepilin-type N-terminal cleavage/methylation domain-containing protein [Bacillota bacterium]
MRHTSERGFTFVEVLVAIFLLTLVTVVIVQIYNSGIFSVMVSGNRTEALYELQEKLELATLDVSPVNPDVRSFTIEIDGESFEYEVYGQVITKQEVTEGNPITATVVVAIPTDDITGGGTYAP